MLESKSSKHSIDNTILSVLQMHFPFVREPYHDLGLRLGISDEDVITHVRGLKTAGVVREISPVMNARRLGYETTLVALKVPQDSMTRAEQFIKSHPGISHAYERTHEFNIWVTFSARRGHDLQMGLGTLSYQVGAEATLTLPAAKMFKLRTDFIHRDSRLGDDHAVVDVSGERRVALSRMEKLIVNAIQQDLPLANDPFEAFASELGIDVETVLSHGRSLIKRGVIRRYGASIDHYRAGYAANAMTCWVVPDEQVDGVARRLASLTSVSHCYERKTTAIWRYNVFAMMHGNSRAKCLRSVRTVSADTGITDYAVLFSTRELKKKRILYRV